MIWCSSPQKDNQSGDEYGMLCCLMCYLRSFIPNSERKKLDRFDTGNVSKGLSPMDTQMQRKDKNDGMNVSLSLKCWVWILLSLRCDTHYTYAYTCIHLCLVFEMQDMQDYFTSLCHTVLQLYMWVKVLKRSSGTHARTKDLIYLYRLSCLWPSAKLQPQSKQDRRSFTKTAIF